MTDKDWIEEIANRPDSGAMNMDEMAATIRALCQEIVRLRQVEKFNHPILRSAMMHMPIG